MCVCVCLSLAEVFNVRLVRRPGELDSGLQGSSDSRSLGARALS